MKLLSDTVFYQNTVKLLISIAPLKPSLIFPNTFFLSYIRLPFIPLFSDTAVFSPVPRPRHVIVILALSS